MFRRLRLLGIMGIAALLAMFALLPIAGAAPRSAETKNVSAKDFQFDPKETTISVGDTISWKNDGAAPHTITADDSSFDSGNMDVGATFSHTFDKAGTFAYFCKYHGAKGGTGMSGTITVAEAAQPQPAAPAASSGSVEVGDQPVSEGSITVAKVTAGQDGWIVAHLDEGGKPGKVIGHSAVKAGDNTDVDIDLSEDVPAGGKLWPMLHIDAGTIGTYEFPGPDAPVIVGGNIVMKQITITAAEGGGQQAAPADAVEAADQSLVDGGITVASVNATVDGWIAVHLDEGGKPGKVIGFGPVKAGSNSNVMIKLSEDVPAGGKLWPMLHIDAGTIGTYEFPGPDAPVIVGGNIIMKQITITAVGGGQTGGGQPSNLPRTGGQDAPLGLLLGALALLLGGALLALRVRRA
jgi:LPXTG-motif cell wall-anchored protein